MVDKRKVFPDESLALYVNAENAKFLPVWLQMSVPLEGALASSCGEESLTSACGLLWYQQARFNWGLVAQRRGVYRVGPPHMKVGDLLGFFPREKRTEGDIHVVVYPGTGPHLHTRHQGLPAVAACPAHSLEGECAPQPAPGKDI